MASDSTRHSVDSGQLAEALREAENRYRSLIDGFVDGLIVIDETGTVRNFNPSAARIFGYPESAVVGKNVNMLMPASDKDRHDGYIERYLDTGDAQIIGIGREVTGLRKDGTEFPMDLSVAEMMVRENRYFIGTVRDISTRKEVEAELRQAHKMEALGQLTGGVAHDFNNLLAVLMMDLELLDELTQGEEELSELVTEAREVARTGAELTRRLLAFSRRQPLQPKALDLNALISNTASLLRRTLGESVEIDIVAPGNLWPTLADPGQVENALLNLAINARDAMPGGGRLTIETQNKLLDDDYTAQQVELDPGEYVLLSVTDTGEGMPPEVIEKAFDPFFSTKDSGHGSGLGLSMIYGFVKQSSGHISIYSEVGRGTSIAIYLPRAPSGESVEPGPAAAAALVTGRETILLVEDHPQLRRRALRVLRDLGYRVIEAKNGDAALETISARDDIDLLFTDIVMPGGLDGTQLAEAARDIRPGLRVLFTTGYAEHAQIRTGLLEQGGDLLRKPYSRRELSDKLRGLLD